MSNELILAVVLTIVLVADLIIRSFKKKVKTDDSPKIGEETSKKRRFNFNYFINRKRNIVTFIILGLVLKPAIHYQFFTELEEYVNTEKKLPAPEKRKDFLKLSNINHNVVKVYGNLFYEEIIDPNQIFYGGLPNLIYVSVSEFSKNYYLKTDEFNLNKLQDREYLNIEGNFAESKKNHWKVRYLNKMFIYDKFNNMISADANTFFENINIPNYKNNFFFMYNSNNLIEICRPFVNSEEKNTLIYFSGSLYRFMKTEVLLNPDFYMFRLSQLYNANKRNGTIFKNFEFIEKSDEPKSKLDTIEDYKEMMESGMYMDYKTKLLYDTPGNQVVTEKDGKMVNFFIHPQELRKSDFNFHLDNIFKLKLWLFSISFSIMGLLVFLFNDKIQAR